MKLTLDVNTFEQHQIALIGAIIEEVVVKLREAGMDGLPLEEATANIAFSIASIIDDTTQIESDGDSVKPYLTFRGEDDELIHCGENAYSYEFVRMILKRLFDV